MNKKVFDTVCSMSDMEDSLVSEAAEVSKKRKGPYWWLAAAAALVLTAGAVAIVPKLMKGKASDPNEGYVAAANTAAPEKTEDHYQDVNSTSVPQATAFAAPPQATDDPMATAAPKDKQTFANVEAVQLAVAANKNTDTDSALYGLTKIYMPTKVPYGAELSEISITQDQVTVSYDISEEYIHDEDDPNRFVLIWHRNWQEGSAEEYAKSFASANVSRTDEGVWVICSMSGIENYAVWEADGTGFGIIVPGYYTEDKNIVGFTGLTEVALGDVDAHSPNEGFDADGIMWINDNGYGVVPLTAFAYGNTYYKPEDGGDGRMIHTEGLGFIESIPEEQKGYDNIMKYFPQSYWDFETELSEGSRIVRIDTYDPVTLEPLELDIEMDRLRDIGQGNVDEELNDRIFGPCHGSVLVDVIVEHEGSFISELNEYETEAYHCGFIIDCGY